MTPRWPRRPGRRTRSGASRCARVGRCAATSPRSTRCTGAPNPGEKALLTSLTRSPLSAGRPEGRVQHDVAAGRAGRGPDREDSDALPPNPPGAFGQNLRHALGVGQQVCLVSFSYFISFPLFYYASYSLLLMISYNLFAKTYFRIRFVPINLVGAFMSLMPIRLFILTCLNFTTALFHYFVLFLQLSS